MKKTRILASAMALAMCFSAMPMSAFAEQAGDPNIQYVSTGNTPEAVEVEISVVSQYSVQIPKKLTIEGVQATFDAVIPYTYKVQGSIAGNEQLKVVPDATVTMMQEGKEDNVGTITQEKQVWSCAEFEALNGANASSTLMSDPQDGEIHVKNMSAGTWNGTFNFNIALEKANLFTFYIDEKPYQAEKDMTWGQWVESEYNTDGYRVCSESGHYYRDDLTHICVNGGCVYVTGGEVTPGAVIEPTYDYYEG